MYLRTGNVFFNLYLQTLDAMKSSLFLVCVLRGRKLVLRKTQQYDRFRKFKVALNPSYNFVPERADHSSIIKLAWGLASWFLSYYHLQLKFGVFYTVAMVTCYVENLTKTSLVVSNGYVFL